MNILIIDSDQEVAGNLADILGCWQHRVSIAPRPDAGLSMSKQTFFEIILIELIIHGEETYPIIPELKLYNPGVSIITMTGESSPELEREARQFGISFYMGKPVDMNQLKLVLDRLIPLYQDYGEWRKISFFKRGTGNCANRSKS